MPAELVADDLAAANVAAEARCGEVNAHVHTEICVVPAEPLELERELLRPLPSLRPPIGKVTTRKVDKLSCIRFGSARYSVPISLIGRTVEVHVTAGRVTIVHLGSTMAEHALVAPGETSVTDDHYGGPRPAPGRALRPRSNVERAVMALGPAGRGVHQGAAASGRPTSAAIRFALGSSADSAAMEGRLCSCSHHRKRPARFDQELVAVIGHMSGQVPSCGLPSP